MRVELNWIQKFSVGVLVRQDMTYFGEYLSVILYNKKRFPIHQLEDMSLTSKSVNYHHYFKTIARNDGILIGLSAGATVKALEMLRDKYKGTAALMFPDDEFKYVEMFEKYLSGKL